MNSDLLKIKFIMKLAGILHRYGASSDRIEMAMYQVSEKLKIKAEYFSLPTSFMGHFVTESQDEYTRMLRLDPGKINLEKLYYADQMVDHVIDEKMTVNEGIKSLEELLERKSIHSEWLVNISIMLLSAGVAFILKGSALDSLVAGLLGLLSGFLNSSVKLERLDTVIEGVICFFIGFFAFTCAHFVPGVNPQVVILSAIIYYVPGLTLTMAMGEISSQNLTAGTARLAGAIIILLKIVFGTFVGSTLAQKVWDISVISFPAETSWFFLPALLIVSFTFVTLFQARWQESFWMIFAASSTYLIHHYLKAPVGNLAATIIAGTYIGASSNLFSRLLNRPSMIVTLPSIILLVPGSVGYKGFEFLFINETLSGINTLFSTFNLGLALVAGTYFGSLLVRPRRML